MGRGQMVGEQNASAKVPDTASSGQAESLGLRAADEMPDEEMLYDLADLFKVFSDTTRVKILFALMAEDLSVGELSEAVSASQSAVSHQLRILKQARLVKFRREGKQLIYSISDDHVTTMLSQGMTHICE